MKLVLVAIFCLGFVGSANAQETKEKLDILFFVDESPSHLARLYFQPSKCRAQYSDAAQVVAEFQKLAPEFQTADSLRKMLDYQMSISDFIASQDPKHNAGCETK